MIGGSAIALTGKDVAKVRITSGTTHFGAHHAVRAILKEADRAAVGRLPERGPATTRVELLSRAKELGSAGAAGVDAFSFGIGVFTDKGRLSSAFTQDVKLLRGQGSSPLLFGALHILTVRQNALVRVLIAPDSFAGSLSAREVAAAIARGWSKGAPHDQITTLPLSDGGPGFVDVFNGQTHAVTVSGPMGEEVLANFVIADQTAYIESAQACGRHLLAELTSHTIRTATTRGVGALIQAALSTGVRRIVIGLGGSATNDGGKGLIDAFGSVDAAISALRDIELVVATDVDNPLLGPQGASAVYGPQKGATPSDVEFLEEQLSMWVRDLGAQQIAQRAGAGAAGGLGFALMVIGGTRKSGIEVVAQATNLADAIAHSDLVITGEGSFDWQSLRGKVVSGVAHLASRVGIPVIVLAGQVWTGRREFSALGIESAYALAETPAEVAAAMADAAGMLERRAERLARSWSPQPR